VEEVAAEDGERSPAVQVVIHQQDRTPVADKPSESVPEAATSAKGETTEDVLPIAETQSMDVPPIQDEPSKDVPPILEPPKADVDVAESHPSRSEPEGPEEPVVSTVQGPPTPVSWNKGVQTTLRTSFGILGKRKARTGPVGNPEGEAIESNEVDKDVVDAPTPVTEVTEVQAETTWAGERPPQEDSAAHMKAEASGQPERYRADAYLESVAPIPVKSEAVDSLEASGPLPAEQNMKQVLTRAEKQQLEREKRKVRAEKRKMKAEERRLNEEKAREAQGEAGTSTGQPETAGSSSALTTQNHSVASTREGSTAVGAGSDVEYISFRVGKSDLLIPLQGYASSKAFNETFVKLCNTKFERKPPPNGTQGAELLRQMTMGSDCAGSLLEEWFLPSLLRANWENRKSIKPIVIRDAFCKFLKTKFGKDGLLQHQAGHLKINKRIQPMLDKCRSALGQTQKEWLQTNSNSVATDRLPAKASESTASAQSAARAPKAPATSDFFMYKFHPKGNMGRHPIEFKIPIKGYKQSQKGYTSKFQELAKVQRHAVEQRLSAALTMRNFLIHWFIPNLFKANWDNKQQLYDSFRVKRCIVAFMEHEFGRSSLFFDRACAIDCVQSLKPLVLSIRLQMEEQMKSLPQAASAEEVELNIEEPAVETKDIMDLCTEEPDADMEAEEDYADVKAEGDDADMKAERDDDQDSRHDVPMVDAPDAAVVEDDEDAYSPPPPENIEIDDGHYSPPPAEPTSDNMVINLVSRTPTPQATSQIPPPPPAQLRQPSSSPPPPPPPLSFNEVKELATYYPTPPNSAASNVTCLLCSSTTHTTSSCPQRTCPHCNTAGVHYALACPSAVRCSKCYALGHAKSSCPEKLQATKSEAARKLKCKSCNSNEHTEGTCHWLWRTFHHDEHLVRKVPRLLVFCYSCGAEGHWGAECGIRRGGTSKSGDLSWTAENARKYIGATATAITSNGAAKTTASAYTVTATSAAPRQGMAIRGSAQHNPLDDFDDHVSISSGEVPEIVRQAPHSSFIRPPAHVQPVRSGTITINAPLNNDPSSMFPRDPMAAWKGGFDVLRAHAPAPGVEPVGGPLAGQRGGGGISYDPRDNGRELRGPMGGQSQQPSWDQRDAGNRNEPFRPLRNRPRDSQNHNGGGNGSGRVPPPPPANRGRGGGGGNGKFVGRAAKRDIGNEMRNVPPPQSLAGKGKRGGRGGGGGGGGAGRGRGRGRGRN
jgi:hypothetical protein